MAEVTVESPIRPQDATCCGKPISPCGGDTWQCQDCGCWLRAERSGFAPRGWRIVTEISGASCTVGHAYETDPSDPT